MISTYPRKSPQWRGMVTPVSGPIVSPPQHPKTLSVAHWPISTSQLVEKCLSLFTNDHLLSTLPVPLGLFSDWSNIRFLPLF
ncbi:unnamed protein product [Hymenolepis diminuta]|uniref:Uncharacterized protein n=1 Tax=Hymenolepis diminuta TaxID=6216 RepID=A0A0R3SHY1_HYMDI|nr:unnamed protein product [Hymenolepis diminuta]